jgi:hypothetical protein
MKKICLIGALSILLGTTLRSPANATKWPNYYWDAVGTVRDWKTKKPIKDVMVLVFLEGAPMHQGWNPEQGDYPDVPRTSGEGKFFATAVLYRTPPQERPKGLEIVVLAEGYRTNRVQLTETQVRFDVYPEMWHSNSFGSIHIPDIEISRYEDIVENNGSSRFR